MKTITIVGDNAYAVASAIILKTRFRDYKISLICSHKSKITTGTTTAAFKDFSGLCGVSLVPIMQAGRCSFKWGTKFEGFTKNPYFDFRLDSPFQFDMGQYLFMYGKVIGNKLPFKKIIHPNLINSTVNKGQHPDQFHFDFALVSKHLKQLAKEKDIKVIEDTITEVITEKDQIVAVKGKGTYSSDFFIDATGEARVLIKHLHPKFLSLKEYLPTNEMISFSTKDPKDYNCYTTVKRMKAGWLRSFPLWGSEEHRYVYNNKYISSENAHKEAEKVLGVKIKKITVEKFSNGYLKNPWIGNCCAIGNSAVCIEPLEETECGVAINQTFILMHYLTNYTSDDVDIYNAKHLRLVHNIRDFISLHYLVCHTDSKFWKELKIKISESLEHKLKVLKHRLPIHEDFSDRYLIFDAPHFIRVLYALGFFDVSKIKKEFNDLNFLIKEVAKVEWDRYTDSFKFKGLPHKRYLEYHYFYKND